MMIMPRRSAVRQKVLLHALRVAREQGGRAAQVADLLVGALDHAVALAALGVEDLPRPRDLEALLRAGLRLQLGHLALLNAPLAGPEPFGSRINAAVSMTEPPRQPCVSRAVR